MKAKKVSAIVVGWMIRGVRPVAVAGSNGLIKTNVLVNKPRRSALRPEFWPPRKVVVTVEEI